MKPIRLVPDETHIPFMWLARFGLPFSALTMVLSLIAFLVFGLNLGIDFKGGTLIEVQSTAPEANLGDIRSRLEGLNLGDVEVQGVGDSQDVLIRIATQRGGDAAPQEAVQRVQQTLGRRTTPTGASRWSAPAYPANWPASGTPVRHLTP
jgi:preprotein translocase subunit SecF